MMTDAKGSASRWWDWRLFGLWVLVNAVAFAVIPLGGDGTRQLASSATKNLFRDQRAIAVLVIAVVGAALHGICGGEAHADHRDGQAAGLAEAALLTRPGAATARVPAPVR